MKPSVNYGPCPICDVDVWSVYGPNGDHWMCTSNQTTAINYAAERSAATNQPGSGDQLRQLVREVVSR